jgi:hypothetical protein
VTGAENKSAVLVGKIQQDLHGIGIVVVSLSCQPVLIYHESPGPESKSEPM